MPIMNALVPHRISYVQIDDKGHEKSEKRGFNICRQ
jgi:hypothetical protein